MDRKIEELRLQLLANGYVPLPNFDKRNFLKGWPDVVVTAEEIRRWSRRHKRFGATGIRVEGGLAVVDIDINMGAEIMEAIAVAAQAAVPKVADALVRRGKGSKEAWFVRTTETFSRIHSRRWTAPGAGHDAATHVVECFGGAAARQFGAFGAHTLDGDGVETISYRWDGPSPADVPQSELPALTKAEFFAIVDAIETELRRLGCAPVEKSTKGESDAHRVHDLTDDMQFDLADGRRVLLPELRQLSKDEDGLRCSASWLEGPDPKRSPDRCLIGRTRFGNLTVWDSATGITHMEVAATKRELPQEFGLALKGASKRVSFAGKVKQLLDEYAFCPTQHASVIPLQAKSISDCMELSKFRGLMQPFCEIENGPRGGQHMHNPVDAWMSSQDRLVVKGLRMRPDLPPGVFEDRGDRWINTYRRVAHNAPPEGVEIFHEFMRHLIPTHDEREWFLDWLAHKLRYPHIPGPGVVMVARKQGAGRGTLFSIVRQLLGPDYVRRVDPISITGESGQSQYNLWLAGSVMVQVDELFNAGASTFLWQRKKAYERLKSLIDPTAREVEIIQKGLNNYETRVFASFLIATNNEPPRVCRRPFGLSHAAIAGASSMA